MVRLLPRRRSVRVSPLRVARLLAGRSLDDVAKAAGMDAGHLSRAERGFADLTPERRRRLAHVLGVRVGDLAP